MGTIPPLAGLVNGLAEAAGESITVCLLHMPRQAVTAIPLPYVDTAHLPSCIRCFEPLIDKLQAHEPECMLMTWLYATYQTGLAFGFRCGLMLKVSRSRAGHAPAQTNSATRRLT